MLSTLAAEPFSGISIQIEALTLVDVMTYETGRATAHTIIYSAPCAADSEPAINDEHVATRWMTAEAYIARFLNEGVLSQRGLPESAIALAAEVARVVRTAAALRCDS